MKTKSKHLSLVFAAAFLLSAPAVLLSSPSSAAAATLPPTLFASVAPNPADQSVTISVEGRLSAKVTTGCLGTFIDPESPLDPFISPQSAVVGGAYSVKGNAVNVISGTFSGQAVPVSITRPAEDGDCEAPGRAALYGGSQSFSTASLANGTYVLDLKVVDELGGTATDQVSFVVQHPSGPAPSTLSVSCEVSPSPLGKTESQIIWSAEASGGTGKYAYSWSGTDGLSGSAATVTKIYSATGPKEGTVKVTSGGVTRQATCSIEIVPKAPISYPECSPHNHPDVKVGELASFSVTGGYPPYAWNSNFGNPETGSGTQFSTRISAAGLRAAKVTDSRGNFSRCFVQVVEDVCTQPSTITVTSDLPTTWTLTGPTSKTQSTPSTGATYTPVAPGGPYQLTPGILAGYTAEVKEAPVQSIDTCGKNLTFDIRYTYNGGPNPPPNPPGSSATLTVTPPLAQIQTGSYAYFKAHYDLDGGGPATPVDVTLGSSWASNKPAVAGASGMSSGSARFLGNSAGSALVSATYLGLTANANITVSSQPPANLSVILAPNPNQGNAPLTTSLNATVGGSATGPISYTFYKNCTYTGTSVSAASSQCGAPASQHPNVSANPQATAVSYATAGSYTAMVIVERGGFAAQAKATVTVNSGPPSGSHSECVNNSCTVVSGAGPNRCGTSADCGGNTGNPPGSRNHGVCDAVQKACVNVSGPGPSTCSSDPACAGTTGSHLECQNQSCVIVSGAGANDLGCTAAGAACTATGGPVGVGSCTLTATPKVISLGGSSLLAWNCTGPVAACALTESVGPLVKAGGPSGSASVSPDETTTYDLNCDSGAVTTSTTVRVLRIIEVRPQ